MTDYESGQWRSLDRVLNLLNTYDDVLVDKRLQRPLLLRLRETAGVVESGNLMNQPLLRSVTTHFKFHSAAQLENLGNVDQLYG